MAAMFERWGESVTDYRNVMEYIAAYVARLGFMVTCMW